MTGKQLLDLYVARYNAGDLDGVMDLYAEDSVQKMPDGTFEGRRAIRERLAQELNGFTDVNHTVRSFVEQRDSFCDEWTFAGTHTRPFPLPDGTELAPTGKRVELPHVVVMKFEHGKVAHEHIWWDQASLLVQVGLLDPANLPVAGVEQARKLLRVAQGHGDQIETS